MPACSTWRQQVQQQQLYRSKALKRLVCTAAASIDGGRKKLVFLGTPEVAALVLDRLLAASREPDADFEIAAVVTQPGRPKGRGNKKVPQPSPVEQLALDRGMPPEQVLSPVKANEVVLSAALILA